MRYGKYKVCDSCVDAAIASAIHRAEMKRKYGIWKRVSYPKHKPPKRNEGADRK
jgi:disulfide oxidoreductase YuzD